MQIGTLRIGETRPRRLPAELLDAIGKLLIDAGCAPAGGTTSWDALMPCALTYARAQADRIDDEARRIDALGVAMATSATPAASRDTTTRALEQKLHEVEVALGSRLVALALQLRTAAKDVRALSSKALEIAQLSIDTFRTWMSNAQDAPAGSAEEANAELEARAALAAIESAWHELILPVVAHAVVIRMLAAESGDAGDAIVKARFLAYADRSRRVDAAMRGWQRTLANYTSLTRMLSPFAVASDAITKGLPAVGRAIGKTIGGATSGLLSETWPYIVAAFIGYQVFYGKSDSKAA